MTIKSINDDSLEPNGDPDIEEAIVIPIDGVLDLHTFSPKELPNLLDDYIRECVALEIFEIRIIHGKGKGILRDMTYSLLRKHPLVLAFEKAPPEAGGWGAVSVKLKVSDE